MGLTKPQCTRTAAILVIGNEVLTGKVTDVNSPFLLKELYALGVDVARVLVIPDEIEVIASEVKQASGSYHYVFTSGGIGPTHDDVTIAAIARAFEVDVVESPELMEMVNEHFSQVTEAARRLARLPRGTELIYGDRLTYPMCVMRNVYIFPGVPAMLRSKFDAIKERFREDPYHLVRFFTLQGESVLAEHLEATLEHYPAVRIGSYPRFDTAEYRVELTLESKNTLELNDARIYLQALLDPARIVRIIA